MIPLLSSALFSSALFCAASPPRREAYKKLEAILSRDEFKGWINPFEYLARLAEKLSKYFSALPRAAQITVLCILTVILALIFIHWLTVFRKVALTRGEKRRKGKQAPRGALSLPASTPARLKREALDHLAAGRTREAVRCLYLATVLLLRARGVIPGATSLTGREIARILRQRFEDFERFNRLFERCAYGARDASGEEARWALLFAERMEGEARTE